MLTILAVDLADQLRDILLNPDLRFAGLSGSMMVDPNDFSPVIKFAFRLYNLANPNTETKTRLVPNNIQGEILSEIVARGKVDIIVDPQMSANILCCKLSTVMHFVNNGGLEIEDSEWDRVVDSIEQEILELTKTKKSPLKIYKMSSGGTFLMDSDAGCARRSFGIVLHGLD